MTALPTAPTAPFALKAARISAIVPDGRAQCVCIAVAHPSKLYITRSGIVTHNTTVTEQTPQQRQFAETEAALGGKPAYEQAKAAGKTKLNYGQWVQVRTPAFKAWFGDWEGDPANASKVVDSETGEPLVVYHGTRHSFDAFRNEGRRGRDRMHYFAADAAVASEYAGEVRYGTPNVMPAYLSVQRPYKFNAAGASWGSLPITLFPPEIARHFDERNILRGREGSIPQIGFTDVNRAAQDAGFDGVIAENIRDGAGPYGDKNPGDVFVTFRPEQIKSAIGNNGNFDGANPDIRFSRASPTTGAGVWQSPEPTKFDQWTYLLQDKQIDTKRVLNAIKSTGQQVDDAQDVYLQETLYHGRTAKRVKGFAEQEERPLMELMRDKGLSLGQVEEYLHARHAPEANKALAERNPSAEVIAANLKAAKAAGDEGEAAKWRNAKPYAGTEEDRLALSGMSDAEAAAVMAALTPEQRTNLQAAAKMVDAIVAKTRQTFVEYGLETQETVDAWGKAWAHYVPLMREQPEDSGMAGMGTGQGFSVKGKETKGRTGSTKKVVDILANIAAQRERAIVRGEKNRVATALLGLVEANENKDFWRIAKPGEIPSTKVIDKKTGLVTTQIDPTYKKRDNALVAKVDGVEQVILFNEDNPRAMRMATALKNMDAANLEGLLGSVGAMTRYLAAINTQYNPIFGITNMVRDFQEAAINLQTTPLAGQQKKVLGNALTAAFGIGKELRAQRNGKTAGGAWGKLWDEFQNEGGQTGYRDMFANSADRSKALQAMLKPDAWADGKLGKFFTANGTLKAPMEFVRKSALRPVLDLLSDYNEAIENGIRLSAYKAALDHGLSKARAAELAKNLTVNFNRKGQTAQQVGALYAFFNASVQGTARMGKTLFDMEPGKPKTLRLSSLGKKIVTGGVLLGSVQALLLAGAGFDEDEPPEFIRERNLVIPNPMSDKGYITIPMPLGYHVLSNIGRIPTEYALGGFKNGGKRAFDLLDVLADIYNPLGGSGLSMQTITPSVIDPLAALAENKDFSGRAIAKVSFDKTTPGHALGRDTSSMLAQGMAQVINYATGGTEYTRGELSPTPDQIDYLIGQVTGGVGREASKVSQTAQALATGDDLPWHKVPLAGRFYGSADTPAAAQSAYYNTLDDVRRHAAEVKGLRNDGRGQDAIAYMQKHPQAAMHIAANRAETTVKKLRDRISELKEQDAPREQVKALEMQMTEVMQQFSAAIANKKKSVAA